MDELDSLSADFWAMIEVSECKFLKSKPIGCKPGVPGVRCAG